MSDTKPAAAPAATTAPKKPQPAVPFLVSAGINCVGGMFAWMFCHPFELVKNGIVTNYQPPATATHVPPDAKLALNWSKTAVMFQKLYYEGGFKRLYRGIGTGQIRQVVYTTSRLSLYDPVEYVFTAGHTRDPTVVDRMLAGGTAGAMAGLMSSPVEVPLVRLSKPGAPNVGFLKMFAIVYQDSGVGGFFRGVGALMQRTFIVGVCQVGFFKQSLAGMTRLHEQGVLPKWMKQQDLVLASSIQTGIFYSLISLPLEQARIRMSAQAGKGSANLKYKNSLQTVMLILKEEGVRSMFSFFTPYASRCTTHTIVSFNVIHLLQTQYKSRFAAVQQKKE